jgi:Domain of unknown function (DUF4129)
VRLRAEYRAPHTLMALALTAVLAAAPLRAAPRPAGQIPSAEQIAAAVKALRQDPNLGGVRKERTLRWVNDNRPHTVRHNAAWIGWISGLFVWFAETSRFLLWGAIIVLVGFLGIFLVRLLRGRPARVSADRFTAPTHVRELDIRPESLPDDIGSAARRLWETGQPRAALALLYRGLISRLVHVHGVPIRGSSTESECLALAGPSLEDSPRRYASRLIRIWELAVYGGQEPPSDAVFALCDEFAGVLPSRMRARTSGAP